MIPSYSPQGKGRIERLWQTLQSRLTVELKCQGIKTLQETNIFLRDYITKFNAYFSLEAKEKAYLDQFQKE